MIESVDVIGARGRVGSAVSARLAERGIDLRGERRGARPPLRSRPAIAEVAAAIESGPWVAHVSGGDAARRARPHARRFSVHPLQTFIHDRGPEQLDGAWAAVSGETDEARRGRLRARRACSGCARSSSPTSAAPLYHAGAAIAVELPRHAAPRRRRAPGRGGRAGRGARAAHAPRDRERLRADRARSSVATGRPSSGTSPPSASAAPDLLRGLRRAAASPHAMTRRRRGSCGVSVARTIAESARRSRPRRDGRIGLVPTMGALHDGPSRLLDAARATCDTVVMSLFVNPAQFGEPDDLDGYPRDEARDLGLAARGRRRPRLRAVGRGDVPARVPDVGRGDRARRDPRGRASAPATSAASRPWCLKLFTIVEPDVAYFGQKDAQQVAVIRRLVRDLALEIELRVVPTVRDADGLALASRNVLLSADERERALALPRALATARPPTPRAPHPAEPPASRSTTSRRAASTHPSSPPQSASARLA